MEQDDWLLVFRCHDGFESEYLGQGLKTMQFPLKEKYLLNAKMEALEIWNRIKNGEVNPPKKGKIQRDCCEDWGHFDPYLVSKNNKNRFEKLL